MIRDIHLKTIPESLRKFEKLNILTLENVGLKKIPDWINELKNLDFISFYGNELEELPRSFADLNYLGILDLSNNSLSSIPESFGFMEFQFLNLKNNQIKTIPLSFLNIEVDEIYLEGNPFEKTPDLKTRFIIESLKRRDKIDIDLPKFKFEFEERDEKLVRRIDDLIEEYYQLRFVSPEDMLNSERKQQQICFEMINMGYVSIDFLIDVFLMGDDLIKTAAEEILDFILCDIEPKWKEIVSHEDFK